MYLSSSVLPLRSREHRLRNTDTLYLEIRILVCLTTIKFFVGEVIMKLLKIINGGASAESGQGVDWRKKFQALHAIDMTLRARRNGGVGPRVAFSALLGLVAGGLAMAAVGALNAAGIKVAPWVFNAVPVVLVVLVYQLGRRYSTKPWTYTSMLDGQLAQYDPVSREAYRQLQERTKQVGSLETEFVRKWLEQEHDAVELAAGVRRPESKGFLDKRI